MDDTKRAIFVLVELEQMTVREAAEALGINFNTAYSRLRVARAAFEAAVAEHAKLDVRNATEHSQDSHEEGTNTGRRSRFS